ncbi:ribosome assembly protein 4 [Trichormus sp. NMC-1]|uniref:WD40 domain-containing protein n=1 Tax=Trichormus sp. NMC-1 TaxID=1853259 RepID=UPI0009F17379|nr:ribosome assembly protein 4 [Trichormus sp. NMC-1]
MTNSQQLEDLAWSLEASQGEFKLILAKCNYIELQNQLIQELQEICKIEIQILQLKPSERTLYNAIKEEFNDEIQALMIVGWESLPNLSKMFSSANQVREEFRNNCQYPLVLWINDQIYQQIMESAPDLESWGITINFYLPFDELIKLLKSIIDKILNDDLNVDLQEIELALQDLQKHNQDLEPDFQANCNFLRGFIAYTKNQLNTAINYYQQNLDFWQRNDNLEIQGKILYNLTICNYEKYKPNPPTPFPAREEGEIINYLQRTLEKFKNAQRLDLIANSLSKFGLILQELQAWEDLKKLATQALDIHKTGNNILKIAEDYIFLATANFEQSNFSESAKIANQGLDVLKKVNQSESDVDYYCQSLFLILAQAQEKLQQYEQAISNLKLAKDIGVINNHPKLYVKILNLLQQLLFQKTEYLEAFNTKLESHSIEQQFGLRAFIGAGWLKPSKNTSFVNQETISPEIEASGRKIDVDKLLTRIGENDKKIIVIHGQSGVGKSSLVNAGLIPALENKAIGFHDNLPVTIRVYNSWFTELKQQLLDVLPERFKPEELKLDTQEKFILKLAEIEKNNLRTVLIFDQFEEFFFVYPDDKARIEFFQFLGKCLNHTNIGSLRVILSLRVDYLHLLLECNELESMKIISQDILSKNVLYKLGNLTTENAKLTIQRLTKNTTFRLEPDLINRLLQDLSGEQDLAGELGSVRPIELQVVGAQLETENITTLAAYQKIGNKQELVKRYLDEVVKDCGVENQEIAELLLYFLTDEQGTRPLKTKAELERDLQSLAAAATQLDLVLEIFVKSGLVVLLPETPADRYQLVHDYLANFIRQQQEPKLKAVIAELEKERQQRKIGEAKLNRFLKFALAGSIAAGVVLAGLTVTAWNAAQQAAINEIQALTEASKDRFALGETSNALIESLKAGGKIKLASWAKSDTQVSTIAALRQAVYLQRHEEKEKRALNVNTLKGHDSKVRSVVFSPDEQQLASGSDDKTIKIWDVTTGKVLNTLKGHEGGVNSVVFSPDGKQLASGSVDKTIKIWDVTTGKVLNTLKGHEGGVNSVVFSPDGKQLASGSVDKTIKIWDMTTGKVLNTLKGHDSKVNSIVFSADGKKLASGSVDKTIKIWDVTTGKVLNTLKGHEGGVNSVVFSRDGKKLASGSVDKTIKIWDVTTGKVLNTLKGHEGGVNSVVFSADGKQLASGSWDSTIKIWDITTGKVLNTLKGHEGGVNSVVFSRDGKKLASVSVDKTIKIWDVTTGKVLNTLKGHDDWVRSVVFSPNGKQLASGSDDKTIKIWDMTTGKVLNTLKGHEGDVTTVGFSPDGKQLASGSDDYTIKIWDVTTGKVLKGYEGMVTSVGFSPDGKQLASGSGDYTIKIWDMTTGKVLNTLKGHEDYVRSVVFSRDGKKLASGSDDYTIKIWDMTTGKVLNTLKGHEDYVRSVVFSRDGKQLASGSHDKTIKIWDVTTGKVLNTLKGHDSSSVVSGVNSVVFSPNSKQLASGSHDKTIKIWDVTTGKVLNTLKGHDSSVNSVVFSRDGKQLASGSSDNTIKIWDVTTRKVLNTLKGHDNWVRSVVFSPDGKQLASGSWDKTIILWDLNLDNLVTSGCNLLNNYLIGNPQVLAELKDCQTPSRLLLGATVLVIQGENLAENDDMNGALANFRTAQAWDNNLKFDPQTKAQEFANKGKAKRLVAEGESIVQKGEVKKALENYAEAQEIYPQLEITASSWHTLCRYGSLNKQAADVMFACEKAVNLSPNYGDYRDSRGLARALTGNYSGAIEDFEAYIKWIDNKDSKTQRQGWVKDLKAGKNPFTDAVLKKLR